MVLESLLNPKKAEQRPWELFFLGLIYASFSILMSLWVFKEYSSIVMVTLTAICSVPLIHSMINAEADKDVLPRKEYWLLKEHGKAASAFLFLSMGFVVSFLIWFVALPSETVQGLFSAQLNTIAHITGSTGGFLNEGATFLSLIINNLKVLVFCLIFSFFFGAGAMFILTWNASVVSAAAGIFIRNEVLTHISPSIASYFQIVSVGLLKYMTHGIFEILAYFICALAGGIISAAAIRYNLKTKEFWRTILDSVDILAISILLLVFAAIVEIFITPKLF